MKALCIALVLLVALAAAKKPKWHQLNGYTFEQYAVDFKKSYRPGDEGYEQRKANFHSNMAVIQAVNSDKTNTWKAGVNMFTDMSQAEFKKLNKFRKGCNRKDADVVIGHTNPTLPLPHSIDWRTANSPSILTAVKHQGSCGSCWAHSAAESIESQYSFLTGMLPVLSVGQINSCTPMDYNCAGCDGGDYVGAWKFLMNTSVARPEIQKAVTENWAYPIPVSDWFASTQPQPYQTTKCRDISQEWSKPAKSWFAELTAAGVKGYGRVDSNSATGGPAAQKALRDVGPQSISVAAGGWQWYESGVYNNSAKAGNASEWGIDHAVQMVGYGYDKELDQNYWIVRNSWSTLWGEDGFIRLWRAKAGEAEPCSPKEYGPVCGTSGALSDLAWPLVYEHTPTKFG